MKKRIIHYTTIPIKKFKGYITWRIAWCGLLLQAIHCTFVKRQVTCKNCLKAINAQKHNKKSK